MKVFLMIGYLDSIKSKNVLEHVSRIQKTEGTTKMSFASLGYICIQQSHF